MLERSSIGQLGESYAKTELEQKGYRILESNWRSKHLEIDLIADHDGILVFVEVKTRSTDYFGEPSEGVHPKKQLNLGRAALAYMADKKYNGEIRFDIVSIVMNKNLGTQEIEIIQDAFWFR